MPSVACGIMGVFFEGVESLSLFEPRKTPPHLCSFDLHLLYKANYKQPLSGVPGFAQSEKHVIVTLDLGVVSWVPMLGVEITRNRTQ